MVEVAIRRCSWTGRCNTYVDRYFLKRHCELTPVNVDLNSPEDLAFWEEDNRLERGEFVPEFDCCDAIRELPA